MDDVIDDEPTHQLDSRGPFTCNYCNENYTIRLYELHDPSDNKWRYFCCPECLVGYDWYILHSGWDKHPEDVEAAKALYLEKFGRTVYPTPKEVYLKSDKRPRRVWLPDTRSTLSLIDLQHALNTENSIVK
jgi:hypothetical protein